jgi:hypothetical protein
MYLVSICQSNSKSNQINYNCFVCSYLKFILVKEKYNLIVDFVKFVLLNIK